MIASTPAAEASMPHILVVDDDREIRELLARFLERNRLRVSVAADGPQARKVWALGHFQLVVLDLMLPGESGLDLCRWFRSQSDVAVIMLTAMAEDTDRIVGLELGADDYVSKPFNPRELLARIRAVLRRADAPERPVSRTATFAGFTLDVVRRRLLDADGTEIALTGGEYELLAALVELPNRVLTRDRLLDLLHGRGAGAVDRAIDVAISRLRRKLRDEGRQATLIKTVRGGGYLLAAEVVRDP